MSQWKVFAVWLRYYTLKYDSYRPTPNDPLHRWYRLVLASAIQVAKQELATRNFLLPDDTKLRCFTREALAAVRRGRPGFGVRTLITAPLGAAYLGDSDFPLT